MIAQILSWFELVALQEVADDLSGLDGVRGHLPPHFDAVFSDKGGNDERSAYVYDTRRVSRGPKIGEIALTESERRHIELPGVNGAFAGFNRNPYIATFVIEGATLLLANAHLFYGSSDSPADKQTSMQQRQLEAYAIGRWCDLRRKSRNCYTPNILAVGDFNLPKRVPGDPIYEALTRRGLRLSDHTTRVPGTNLAGTHHYDQIAFVPGLRRRIAAMGVFDFDGAAFANLWDPQRSSRWRTCLKYYLSDHRPLWMQLALS